MTGTILLILFYIVVPVVILFLCRKIPFLNKIGAVVVAYIIGLILGNIGILPKDFFGTQDIITSVTISLAIPLLLFSLKLKSWLSLARNTFISMMLALVAVVSVVVAGWYIWGSVIPEAWKVSGMLIGVYTGGTPNLAAIKTGLEIDPNTYVITHSYDLLLSAIYLVILLTFGKVLLRKFLPRFPVVFNTGNTPGEESYSESYRDILQKSILKKLLIALLLSVLIFATGYGLGTLIVFFTENKEALAVTVIITISTLGLLASLVPAINRIPRTYELGMYFILVFSVVVASMADISAFNLSSLPLFLFVAFAIFGSLVVHILLSKLFKIDADTTIITSTAFICSPPFVPVIAGALKNRHVIISGLTIGIIGYAIGNYIGIFVAWILK